MDKKALKLENEKLKEILKKVYEDCYMIGIYGKKNRIKKKNIIELARKRYEEILNSDILNPLK